MSFDTYQTEIIIIGAGAAGLAAAHQLSKAGGNLLVLEGRDRIGGRAYTKAVNDMPVELGAEFIHGSNPAIWQHIRAGNLATRPSSKILSLIKYPDDPTLKPMDFSITGSFLQKMEGFSQEDCSVETFINDLQKQGVEHQKLDRFKSYIEGYNAAYADKISVHSIVKANNESSDDDNTQGFDNFHIEGGYGQLMQYFASSLPDNTILLNSIVETVQWQQNHVGVTYRDTQTDKKHTIQAHYLLSTLPIGVEKSYVRFQPPLTHREKCLQSIEMGNAIRIVFDFNDQFLKTHILPQYDMHDFDGTFVMSHEGFSWWTTRANNTLLWTAWAAGPKAYNLQPLNREQLIKMALISFAEMFNISIDMAKQNLRQSYYHDWHNDPLSKGAYSYIAVGGLKAQAQLAKPIKDTLFFAGEAIPPAGQTGVVDGAIASGERAAGEMLQALVRHL